MIEGPLDSHVYALATGRGQLFAGLGDGTLLQSEDGEELSPSGGERVDEEFIESGELPPEQMIERARQLREEAELPEFEPYRRSHLIVAGRMEEAAQARLAATDQSGKR